MRIELPSPELPLRPQVQLSGLWHRYRGPAASGDWTLRNIDFQLRPGELVGLLGPSGCGKTTLLRLIAGFERPERGVVTIAGQEVAGPHRWLPPERRGVGMVFQDYALFPHLDAWRNTCFGLRRGQDTSRAAWLLELLGLKGLERRFPHELSGGQRQRLALARALAPGCSLVLLDEPFSNLDVEVRLRLRAELPGVLARCGASGLIVTHDPEEALAICDRVAVMRDGVLHQCASPPEIVRSPATPFVGSFVLQRNLIPVQAHGQGQLSCLLGDLDASAPWVQADREASGDCCVLVDPHDITVVADAEGEASVLGREFLGDAWEYRIRVADVLVRAHCPIEQEHPPHTRCRLSFRDGARVTLLPLGQALA